MAVPDKIYPLRFRPGVQRDGTKFLTDSYTESQWCRWYNRMPKKIGGYKQITGEVDAIPTGLFSVNSAPNFNIYIGDDSDLRYITIDSSGNVLGNPISRTPASFAASPYNSWTFDIMFSTTDNSSILIAHAAPNLFAIDNSLETQVWYGETGSTSPLIATGFSTSGGIVVLHPYLFIFGNNGHVQWSRPNDPTAHPFDPVFPTESARVTGEKIVAGFPTRGGNSSPAGLLWSLDSLIRVTHTADATTPFIFDTISSESSVLSSRSIVEYDGLFFWAASDRFLVYNGAVQELPNSMTLNYFFGRINMSQRQKVWATKITRWGEIWWHYPSGNNTECDSAVIYNIRERTWYDTSISRSIGYFTQTFDYPIWASNTPNNPPDNNTYSIWMHENGVDQNINGTLSAIPSYCQTGPLSLLTTADNDKQGIDRWSYLFRLEPDFNQSGGMSLEVLGKEYANSPTVSSSTTWSEITDVVWSKLTVSSWFGWGQYVFFPTTEKIDMREQRRELYLKFSSNVIGGNYEMGNTLMVMRIGDGRQ